MPASTPWTEEEEVRNKTSNSVVEVPATAIQKYLLKYMDREPDVRIYLAAAEVCELINRDARWQSSTQGAKSVSGNLMMQKIDEYRRLAAVEETYIV